jgi:hypothetical protein
MQAWQPKSHNVRKHWNMKQMGIPTLSDSEEKRPVQSKKSSKTTKKVRAGKLAKEYVMDKVNKAAKEMIDNHAEDDGADDDDMQDYGDMNLDEYDYNDGFLRNDQSEPTEYASDEEQKYSKQIKKFCNNIIKEAGNETTYPYPQSYRHAKDKTNGRLFASTGLQNIHRDIRGLLCRDTCIDYDMRNCHPTILLHLAKMKIWSVLI